MSREADSVLVKAAIKGDGESFTELCRRYYTAMVAIAHSITGDRHLAEDAAQQAFAKAAVKLGQLSRKGRFGGWLAAICRNEARDMAGSADRTVSIGDFEPAEAAPSENAATEAVKEALAVLPESEREVIFLRFYDGMSYEQISAVLGISQQAINGRLRRAKQRLAERLRQEGFGEVRL
ncbi:MAG: sigma-70 family RNA polymerase sigma factor [Sedimentisphaerales bacterium]|nr:sigma-70 family RNA polymerase sigma factor [Sedimentisphaerales bacterium]